MIENVTHPNWSPLFGFYLEESGWWAAVGRMMEKNVREKLWPGKGDALEPVSMLCGTGGAAGLEVPSLMCYPSTFPLWCSPLKDGGPCRACTVEEEVLLILNTQMAPGRDSSKDLRLPGEPAYPTPRF